MASLFELHVEKWKDGCGSEICDGSKKCFARGAIPCDILFVGEAPGESENVLGKPFVGPAGKLLDQIANHAIQGRASWALTNLVLCFPREAKEQGINEPPAKAVKACKERLVEFVRMCQPKLIVLVGKLAKKSIVGQNDFATTGEERTSRLGWIPDGKFLQFVEITHPAAILRANVAQQGLAIQQCIVRISNAVEDICP